MMQMSLPTSRPLPYGRGSDSRIRNLDQSPDRQDSSPLQLPNLNILEPRVARVILYRDLAFLLRMPDQQLVHRRVRPPARARALGYLGRIQAAIHHLHAIEPV